MDQYVGVSAASESHAWEVLTSQGWLSHVDADFQQAVLSASILRRKPAGQSLTHAGDDTGYAFGIVEGQVDFTSCVSVIDAPISDIALPGDWWGFRPLYNTTRAIHAVARTSLLLAEVPLPVISSMLEEHPYWWRHISIIVALKQERWGGGMTDMTIRSSRLRCIAVLLRLAGCRNAQDNIQPVTIHFTQDQLAAAANISRYPTGTILRNLAKQGFVSLGYGTITVVRAGDLCAMVNDV